MKTFRIVGVPEHFNFPLRILNQLQPFKKDGIMVEWREESRGSGQMATDLKEGKADMAIMLTESFMKEFESNPKVKMAGYHVQTPLTWGIHVSHSHQANQVNQIQSRHFLVSRMGSGSHLMAMVLANSMGWDKSSLTFEIVGNLDGAKKAFESGNPGMFLWEKYTTAPEVKLGTMKRIGEVSSPWPCFVFVVNDHSIQKFQSWVTQIRDSIYSISKKLKSEDDLASNLAEAYQLDLEDVEAWLKQTDWETKNEIEAKQLDDVLEKMVKFEIITKKPNPKEFLYLTDLEF